MPTAYQGPQLPREDENEEVDDGAISSRFDPACGPSSSPFPTCSRTPGASDPRGEMERYLIEINRLSGASIIIECDKAINVWELKHSIKESIGATKRRQRIIKGARVLGNREIISQECALMLMLTDAYCHVCRHRATKSCSRCFSAWYCSEACQREDWQWHKQQCENTPQGAASSGAVQHSTLRRARGPQMTSR